MRVLWIAYIHTLDSIESKLNLILLGRTRLCHEAIPQQPIFVESVDNKKDFITPFKVFIINAVLCFL